jgi:NitT/TauT family transport system substrate-binding protein
MPFHFFAASRLASVLTGLALLASAVTAHAEEGRLRVAQQFGIMYLLLDVAQEQHLIEKYGKAAGVDIKVEYVQLSGGNAVNTALLSDSVDIAGGGLGPLFTMWDRTLGRQNVKGVVALGNFPYYLISNNPAVKTLADFSDKDRIATPEVGISVQSRILQMASAKLWGDKNYDRLNSIQVALPQPDAAASLIKGGTEVDAHFSVPPFQEQELAGNPRVHVVLNSYDVLGGPASATAFFATQKFHDESPKTYKAFVDAMDESAKFITAHPDQAVDIYLKANGGRGDRALLLKIIKNPAVQFRIKPENTLGMGQFLYRVGVIKHKPAALKDYFFDDPRVAAGN